MEVTSKTQKTSPFLKLNYFKNKAKMKKTICIIDPQNDKQTKTY
jgi:hypothetical protein